MTSNDNDNSEDKQRANFAVKVVAASIAAGIVVAFLIGYVINI